MKQRYRTLELFSGAGGLALGLEAAGFETCALIEYNRDACLTLKANRPQWNVIRADVTEIDFKQFGEVDIVAGGPPCQPFSIGGKANGFNDRRDMFPQAVRAVRELQPLAFIFENVRGLLRPAFRNYVEFIKLQLTYPDVEMADGVSWETNFQRLQKHHTSLRRLEELSYQVGVFLADAANYGVPQRRHRVFFIGFRSDIDAKWHFPSPTHSHDSLLVSKWLTRDYWNEHCLPIPGGVPEKLERKVAKLGFDLPNFGTKRWRTVRDAIGDLPFPAEKSSSPIYNHNFQAGAKAYPGHTGSEYDEPSKALKAGDHGVPGGENMLAYPDGTVRYFSVRESARIQTFPDDYKFAGSWTESMRQLGNAVPVELAKQISLSVSLHLDKSNARRICI